MKKENKRILIATGGTGGHIFPSLSLADFLKTKHRVEIVTDKRGLKYLANDKKINIRTINSDTIFGKSVFKACLGIIKIILSFIFSIFSMISSRPKLIIGMGGYSSFPVCVAGYCLKIPVVIYENNLIIGRANKLILPIARKILVSTKDVQGVKSKHIKKIFFSGYLIRSHILNLKKENKQNLEKKS